MTMVAADTSATSSSAACVPAPATPTHLQARLVAPLLVILLTDALCSTMLLPFVGLFVAHLTGSTVEDAGYSSGILIGLFMLGQFVSGKTWGDISDTYGRKVPLGSGLFAGTIITVLFGISPNIYVCYLLRFLHGCSNGNSLVAKSIIADITDKTNEAKGFALVSITWSLGSLFGPAIGGFLYDPVINPKTQWMHISKDSFIGRNPAFLPSLIVGVYTGAAFLCCVFLLPETNKGCKPLSSMPVVGRLVVCLDAPADDTPSRRGTASTDVVVVECDDGCRSKAPLHDAEHSTMQGVPSEAAPPRRTLSYGEAWRIAPIRNVCFFYMLICISDMCFSEVMPLWAVASTLHGGLGLFSDDVAILNLSNSIPAVLANMGFAKMCDIMNSFLRFWRWSAVLSVVTTALIPCGSEMRSAGYYFVLIIGIFRQVGFSWNYSLVYLLTAKSAPPGCVGSVYGISQSCASISRSIVPFIATPLFAWSLKDGHVFPFNHYLLFFLAVVPVLASYFLTYTLQLLPSETEISTAAVAEVHGNSTSARASDGADGAASQPSAQRNGDGDDGAHTSAYASLVASFATTSVCDVYLNFNAMESQNARDRDLVRQRGGACINTDVPLSRTAPVTDPIAALFPRRQEEDTRAPAAESECELEPLRNAQV